MKSIYVTSDIHSDTAHLKVTKTKYYFSNKFLIKKKFGLNECIGDTIQREQVFKRNIFQTFFSKNQVLGSSAINCYLLTTKYYHHGLTVKSSEA